MVESREPEDMPEPSNELEQMTVEEVLELKLRNADSDGKREALMWKSVAAENLEDVDERPDPPAHLQDRSEQELKELELGEAGEKPDMIALLEWAIYTKV